MAQFYNKWGTAEQWTKQGNQAVKVTRLSSHRLRSNEVRLSLIARTPGTNGCGWRRAILTRRLFGSIVCGIEALPVLWQREGAERRRVGEVLGHEIVPGFRLPGNRRKRPSVESRSRLA